MLKRQQIASMTTPDGETLELLQRGKQFFIDLDSWELMASHAYGSEEEMARLASMSRKRSGSARWLVGGLGMGYTLRAVLDVMDGSPGSSVVISEVFQAVVDWNRGPLAHLAARPLDDSRVEVALGDVFALLDSATDAFDIVLLDVDNGPDAFTLASNQRLYSVDGLRSIRQALRAGGVLAVWSSADDNAFRRRLGKAGFNVKGKTVRSRPDRKGRTHTVFLAKPR